MLLSLNIADFVLVDRLELEFQAGFAVLTGETGAGKSILLDALSLALGGRADAGVVRQGAQRAEVAAAFALDDVPALADWLRDNDLAGDDDTVLLRRVIDVSGRSRAFVNGRAVTAQQLKEAGEHLIDIHGQHAHYSLLKTAEQRRLLDAYAGAEALAADVAHAWQTWRAAAQRHAAARDDAGALAEERERLSWEIRELDALAFSAEGWLELQDSHRRLAHAAELLDGARGLADVLEADDAGVLTRLRGARAGLADLAGIDERLREPLGLLESAVDTLHELARELARYADRIDLDPHALREAEARLGAVQDVARKLRLRPEDIPARLAECRARLGEIGARADLDALARAETAAATEFQTRADELSRARAAAGARLARAVTGAMQALAMKGGEFAVQLTPGAPAAHGVDDVEFLVSPHAGQALKPLARTASGGELSRVGLALQTVLSGTSGSPTLIFDEVDAGIGGGVAEIVGRMLAALGASRQVLCVTHLPQVAAAAAWHYRVSKDAGDAGVVSRVQRLDGEQRVEELARMLGGVRITEATRAHAREMLATAA
jgi:DNA repair protein RecN (Recombination protein N)